jgi:hypothetical protein
VRNPYYLRSSLIYPQSVFPEANWSRGVLRSLERRIEQLEALASEAGINIFSGHSELGTVPVRRNRSHSSVSSASCLSLSQPMPQDSAANSASPANDPYERSLAMTSESAMLPFDNIPVIEVTASSQTQPPDPWNDPAAGYHHIPDQSRPGLELPSNESWYFASGLDSPVGSPMDVGQDRIHLSRRSSASSSPAFLGSPQPSFTGIMPMSNGVDTFLQDGLQHGALYQLATMQTDGLSYEYDGIASLPPTDPRVNPPTPTASPLQAPQRSGRRLLLRHPFCSS